VDQAANSSSAPASEIQPILESSAFRKAVALRRLLVYLWENRHQAITEYAIAVDALQRRPDFDPRTDATVRVHVARLRQKLKEYHESEGAGASTVLTIPPGSYQLEIQQRPSLHVIPMPPRDAARRWRWIAIGSTLAAVAAIGVAVSALRPSPPPQRVALPGVWRSFWNNGKPVKLVIPTPVFFIVGRLRVRDVSVDEFEGYTASPSMRRLVDLFGRPGLSQSYTVTSDAVGAVRLVQHLAAAGKNLEVAGTGDLSLELFGDHNLIIMGAPPTSPHMRDIMKRSQFATRDGTTIENLHPRPGESPEWRSGRISDRRGFRPGLIALLPGQGPGTQLMLFTGHHTASLASFLISPAGSRALDQTWAQNGSPPYFEAVILAEVDNHALVKGRPVAFRPVSANVWKSDVTVR